MIKIFLLASVVIVLKGLEVFGIQELGSKLWHYLLIQDLEIRESIHWMIGEQ